MAWKPSNNHPWKNGPTPAIAKWAKEKSDISNIQTVLIARDENFSRKDISKMESGRQI